MIHAEKRPYGDEWERLCVYGSLRPGQTNHHVLAAAPGEWFEGTVTGELVQRGWGAQQGFPALVWSERGERVPVRVLVSQHLPAHWARLDAFEGPDYRRIMAPVRVEDATLLCNIYVLRESTESGKC